MTREGTFIITLFAFLPFSLFASSPPPPRFVSFPSAPRCRKLSEKTFFLRIPRSRLQCLCQYLCHRFLSQKLKISESFWILNDVIVKFITRKLLWVNTFFFFPSNFWLVSRGHIKRNLPDCPLVNKQKKNMSVGKNLIVNKNARNIYGAKPPRKKKCEMDNPISGRTQFLYWM